MTSPSTTADGAPGRDLATAYRLLVADVYEVAGRSRQTSEALARSVGQTVPAGTS